ncbi:hypothetical protein SK128_006785 [Halocaridina rubra]|uniref:Zonadhesin n=1 Tax=Halocaridina rubra TaxID=373956 RepID=A0AAN8ZWL3_HALRR
MNPQCLTSYEEGQIMLAVVLLAIVATLQVECAPSQLWPAFEKVAAPPTKKPIFSSPINKETTTTKTAINPHATQHAHEQFINTWLRQASITLNRPDILKYLSLLSSQSNTPAEPAVVQTPAVQEPVASPAVLEIQDVPVDEPIVVGLEEPALSGSEIVSEVVNAPKQLIPQPIEVEPEAPILVEGPVVEQTEVIQETTDVPAEVYFVAEELTAPIKEPEIVEEVVASQVPEEIVAVEPVPSLVQQDTETVLLASSATPLAEPKVAEVPVEQIIEEQPLELLEPVTEIQFVPEPILKEPQPTVSEAAGKSFSSGQPEQNVVVPVEAMPSHQPIPIAAFFPRMISTKPSPIGIHSPIPTFATAFPVAPLSAMRIPGAVTTDGLSYTLQFFPSRGRSHYFVSTAVGS